jgi:hypothetical protein
MFNALYFRKKFPSVFEINNQVGHGGACLKPQFPRKQRLGESQFGVNPGKMLARFHLNKQAGCGSMSL